MDALSDAIYAFIDGATWDVTHDDERRETPQPETLEDYVLRELPWRLEQSERRKEMQ